MELYRARTASARAKVLQDYDCPLLRHFLAMAYNPYLRFGVVLSSREERDIITESAYHSASIDDPMVSELLETLSTSTAGSSTKKELMKRAAGKMTPRAAWLMCQVVNKKLFDKVAQSTVEKAFPGLTPTFGVQLAAKYTTKKVKSWPRFVEPKFDGLRAIAIVHTTGEIEVTTRTGRDIPAAKFFHDELTLLGNKVMVEFAAMSKPTKAVIIDGEIVASSFNDSMSIYRAGEVATEGTFQVFDVLPIEAFTDPAFVSSVQSVRRGTLRRAMESLPALTKIKLAASYVANSDEEIRNFYTTFVAQGLEGVIVKDPDGTWQKKRSNDWLKIKGEDTADLPIIGAFEGEGEMEGTLGGLILDFNGVEVRVGSGFKREERDELWEMFLRDMTRIANGEDEYELIGYPAEVSYQEITPAKSLRHPVFKKVRFDKLEASF